MSTVRLGVSWNVRVLWYLETAGRSKSYSRYVYVIWTKQKSQQLAVNLRPSDLELIRSEIVMAPVSFETLPKDVFPIASHGPFNQPIPENPSTFLVAARDPVRKIENTG